jgi:hypothetical protein
VSTSLLEALDSLAEFDAEGGEEILFDWVDPDALDVLFESTPTTDRTDGWVCFPVGGFDVAVSADDEIVIRERDASPN